MSERLEYYEGVTRECLERELQAHVEALSYAHSNTILRRYIGDIEKTKADCEHWLTKAP